MEIIRLLPHITTNALALAYFLKNQMTFSYTGPEFSRLDRLLPYSGPAPKGAHATPTNRRKLTLSIEPACVVPLQMCAA